MRRRQAQAAMSGPSTLRGIRDFQRMFAAGASQEVLDSQGRVTIPATLRDYAGLGRECTVIGAGSWSLSLSGSTVWAESGAFP